ncbi:hypothetical protein GGS24DRAFT_446823 [Hypoxylon argillaceum]|nr:hypothetical protein GGS24DRAFT_446823 [Hypoxylon argillaceum]
MRYAISLLATSSCADAAWLRWSVNRERVWAARETGHVKQADHLGWTPIPTPAPGLKKDREAVLETEWENSNTCGWFAGISSSAFTCQEGFTCSTNARGIVACASDTISPFYSECIDFGGFMSGSCQNVGTATGCCYDSSYPACGLYSWTGTAGHYMYGCFPTEAVLTILNVPQFVVDASVSSQSPSTPTDEGISVTFISTETSTSGSPSLSITTPGLSPATSGTPDHTVEAQSHKIPIIIGSITGGVVGILSLVLVLLFIRRKRILGLKSKIYTAKEDALSMMSQSSVNKFKFFWNRKHELDSTAVRAELDGTPVEDRGRRTHTWKPEFEGTLGIQGLLGMHVKKKAELEACDHAAESSPRNVSRSLSVLEYLLHPFARFHTAEPVELPG